MLEFRRVDGRPLPPNPDDSPVGLLPLMLDRDDPRPAREQIDGNYQHGGGWRPINGFKMLDPDELSLVDIAIQYPGDPPLKPIAFARLRDEFMLFYPHSFLAIFQDGREAFEVARVD